MRIPHKIMYKDKADQAKAARRHYEKNKDLIKKRAVIGKLLSRKRNNKLVKDIKLSGSCAHCGLADYRVLEFHHVEKKTKEISVGSNAGWGEEKLLAEIAKCILLCANCHRIETWYKETEADSVIVPEYEV